MRRIQQISVTNLFGMFNHVIPLKMNDRITIMHGPNGFGKTVLLQLLCELFAPANLSQLFSRRYVLLRSIPFDEFRITFDDGFELWVTKATHVTTVVASDFTERNINIPYLTFCDSNHHSESSSLTFKVQPAFLSITMAALDRERLLSTIERTIPELERVEVEAWEYHPTGERLTILNLLERFGDQLPVEVPLEPEWLHDARKLVFVRFIETQRLLAAQKNNGISDTELQTVRDLMVLQYSQELAEAIKTRLAESVALSQSLDRTFPTRVINLTTQGLDVTENELYMNLAEMEEKRSRLMAVGLIDQDNIAAFQVGNHIDNSTKVMLSVYVDDTVKKLAIFDEMADKVELLMNMINHYFLYKRMSVTWKKGFVFTSQDGANLSPGDLSSGEQHILVLFYELLFKSTQDALILIDEPELSLHVVWQEQFLSDVQKITQLALIDVLMATHSPDIINDRRDLVVELEGPR